MLAVACTIRNEALRSILGRYRSITGRYGTLRNDSEHCGMLWNIAEVLRVLWSVTEHYRALYDVMEVLWIVMGALRSSYGMLWNHYNSAALKLTFSSSVVILRPPGSICRCSHVGGCVINIGSLA